VKAEVEAHDLCVKALVEVLGPHREMAEEAHDRLAAAHSRWQGVAVTCCRQTLVVDLAHATCFAMAPSLSHEAVGEVVVAAPAFAPMGDPAHVIHAAGTRKPYYAMAVAVHDFLAVAEKSGQLGVDLCCLVVSYGLPAMAVDLALGVCGVVVVALGHGMEGDHSYSAVVVDLAPLIQAAAVLGLYHAMAVAAHECLRVGEWSGGQVVVGLRCLAGTFGLLAKVADPAHWLAARVLDLSAAAVARAPAVGLRLQVVEAHSSCDLVTRPQHCLAEAFAVQRMQLETQVRSRLGLCPWPLQGQPRLPLHCQDLPGLRRYLARVPVALGLVMQAHPG